MKILVWMALVSLTLDLISCSASPPPIGDYDKAGADGRRGSRVRAGSGIRSLSSAIIQ